MIRDTLLFGAFLAALCAAMWMAPRATTAALALALGLALLIALWLGHIAAKDEREREARWARENEAARERWRASLETKDGTR